jgi:tetratricopeptide (TPR) repeat protein
MTASLYEQYKDALRQGHVAALRDRLDIALVAYAEAARLAPERPLAYVSLGAIHLRLGDTDAALAAYGEAIERSPRDEAALGGRADALARAGRRMEAAETLDVLADVQEASGRVADACDTALLALEQAESKQRRRHVERLTEALRAAVGDRAAEQALARALQTLEPAPDLAGLTADAEASLDVGDTATARDRLLTIARIHGKAGRFGAALDACYQALAVAPADPDLHLTLAELYVDHGWRTLAADKLVLIARLLDLAEDAAARERMCEIIAERFPGDARLAAICS